MFYYLVTTTNFEETIRSNILKLSEIKIQKLETGRLILIPYTIEICENILLKNHELLYNKGYKEGKSWPDEDVMDTIPRIIKNLSKNNYATGLESWLIIKKETKEIIGDVGFKGYNFDSQNVDLGYGIISEERRKGYAEEASRELINWVLKLDYIKEITANCSTENFQSIHLLNKLAFHQLKVNESMIYWSLKKLNLDNGLGNFNEKT